MARKRQSKKRIVLVILALVFLAGGLLPGRVLAAEEEACVTYVELLSDMVKAYRRPSEEAVRRIDEDAAAMNDPVAFAIAEIWKQTYVDRDYRMLLFGRDDPGQIPVQGKHAFVVLGYRLEAGRMTRELRGRCDAAAAAAAAFPDSLLVCTGGATGKDNPLGNTEAGLMKEYLVETCGVDPRRILTEEASQNTAENAANVMALLEEQQVETITIITSDYHQRRAQVIYTAVVARCRQEQGYGVEIVGNYSFAADHEQASDYISAIKQLRGILGLTDEQWQQLSAVLYGR